MDKKVQKKLRFEVDQSIRVEELSNDTIIGIANEENYFTIKIPHKTKKQLYGYYKEMGRPKKFGPSVFSAGIIMAIRLSKLRVTELVIDIEYPGYELEMRKILIEHLPGLLIYFGVIGKKSPAHFAAYGVHIKKRELDELITVKEILKIIKN